MPRPIVVETAAPVTPNLGNGPRPKMKQGSRIRLMKFESQSTRIATAASPAPRNTPLFTKRRTTATLLPRTIAA